jgi:uncharacterized membrane protein HdeD (DUF308 family)
VCRLHSTVGEKSMVKFVAFYGIAMIVSGILAAILAGVKKRDHSFWAAWSFLFPPMLLILLVIPTNRGPRQRRLSLEEAEHHEGLL